MSDKQDTGPTDVTDEMAEAATVAMERHMVMGLQRMIMKEHLREAVAAALAVAPQTKPKKPGQP